MLASTVVVAALIGVAPAGLLGEHPERRRAQVCLDLRPLNPYNHRAMPWLDMRMRTCKNFAAPGMCRYAATSKNALGVTAAKACCACGGGVRMGGPSTHKATCPQGYKPSVGKGGHRRALQGVAGCTSCKSVAPNAISASGKACTLCPPGTQPSANRARCVRCQGMLVSAHGSACVNCPRGTIRNPSHTGCMSISLGPPPIHRPPPPPPPPPPPTSVAFDATKCGTAGYRHVCCAKPCKNGGLCAACSTHACIAERTAVKCTCPRGFSGNFCKVNVDECASQPCHNGARCVDSVRAFRCNCLAGYEGLLCEEQVQKVPPPPPVSKPTPPPPPVCVNAYDDGTNSCSGLLATGFDCKSSFCDSCTYSHQCDKVCGLCDDKKVKAAVDTSLPCANAYDKSNGDGSCAKLISIGYTCGKVFCEECAQSHFCDGTCGTCPKKIKAPRFTPGASHVTSCGSVDPKAPYSPLNPRASVHGLQHVRDCHGDCVEAAWYADGRCDDSELKHGGNFFCKSLHFDGGDCLTDDGCEKQGKCSLCGSRWKAVMDRCPASSNGSPVPSTCKTGCADMWTEWWKGCRMESAVSQLDKQLNGALTRFTALCQQAKKTPSGG